METSRNAVEKNLSEIAFASLAEKTPALMDYYLGFDLVEKNDAGTRAAGIMGFKIGKQLVYIPIFFLNGKLKGTEVMYLKNSDIFVNNSEQWVNYIVGQAQAEMGEAQDDSKSPPDSAEASRALALFTRPPASATKTASIEDYSLHTVEDFIDKDVLTKPSSMDLITFIKKAGSENFKKIAEVLTQEDIWKCVTRVYPVEELKAELADIASAQSVKIASAQEEVPHGVTLVRVDDALDSKVASSFTEEEKSQLFVEGYIVKNAVEGKDATKMYLEDEKDSFQAVTESGKYKILNKSGDLVEALVFVGPIAIDAVGSSRGGANSKIVINPSTKSYVDTCGEVYFRNSQDTVKASEEIGKKMLVEGGQEFGSMSVGNTYLIVGGDQTSYGPFEVLDKVKDNGATTVSVRQSYCCCGGSYNTVNIRPVDLENNSISRAGDTIYVPKGYKFLEVKEVGYKNEDTVNIRPGDFSTVIDALTAKGGLKAIFEKSNNDLVTSIEGKTASFTNRGDFVYYLCDTMSLPLVSSEKIASKLIDEGVRSFKAVFMPKTAAYPDIVDPNTSDGVMRDGTPQQMQAGESQTMVPSTPADIPATDPMFGTWDKANPQELSLLERASNADSREVFDPAMIGILVRTTRAESIVQEYIPEFIDNLDRMIRLLLLFYWHNAEFADNYGIDEMADFEDLLLSTIKTTGKTILFLKQKSVESSSGMTDVLK
jgi:hypothetical protein